MNVYFSCAITGGRSDQQVYQAIVNHLTTSGHEVPTAHLAGTGVLVMEQSIPAEDVFRRDDAWVRGCDVLIAEVSTPSHGVGYELALALSLGKPALCLYREGTRVSKMIIGNTNPLIRVTPYHSIEQALKVVNTFLVQMRR
jgi:2'-deoxynucleoside 5'-phosphate N-hydrolase